MMKEFLTDHVRMLAEVKAQDTGKELTDEEIHKLVDRLMDDDDLWSTFDDYIYDELEDMKGE